MKLTYKKEKGRIFSVEERRVLLKECASLIGKDMILLEKKDSNVYTPGEIIIHTIRIADVEWDAFFNYPKLIFKINNKGLSYGVDASRLGVSLFEDISDVNNTLIDFFNGGKYNFHPTLSREHTFSKLLWRTAQGESLKSGYILSNKNQVLCFDKEEGVLKVVQINDSGDKWCLTNKETLSIMEEELHDTDKYSYYKFEAYNDVYVIDKDKDFRGDIQRFIEKQIHSMNNDSIKQELECISAKNELEDISEELLEKAIANIIQRKMPEIVKEAIYMVKNKSIQ